MSVSGPQESSWDNSALAATLLSLCLALPRWWGGLQALAHPGLPLDTRERVEALTKVNDTNADLGRGSNDAKASERQLLPFMLCPKDTQMKDGDTL